jgi:GNAT superfamily N-acetyltransferase
LSVDSSGEHLLAATVAHPPLREATSADVRQLAGALAAAFQDDPAFTWIMPVDRKRRAGLRRFFEVELKAVGLGRGRIWTTPELTGACLSTPPGRWRLPLSAMLRHGPAFTRAFAARLPHAAALLQRMEWRHPREPHHYFAYIGVAPEHQGKGLGSTLMQPTLRCCDEAALPAYLEASNERCAALYERLGFELVDELHYGSTQPLRLMLRPPVPRERD